MINLDVMAFGVFGGEHPPGTHIDDFANDLNRLRFPLLVDRVGLLDCKTWNDAAVDQGNAIGFFSLANLEFLTGDVLDLHI